MTFCRCSAQIAGLSCDTVRSEAGWGSTAALPALFPYKHRAFLEDLTMSSQNGNGQQSATAAPTGTMHELAPCSCCMALAHVRLPHGAINPPTDAAAVATSPAAQTCSAPAKKRRSLFSFMNPGNVFSINRGYSKPVAAAAENPDENTGSTSSANTTAPHDEWDEALMGPRPRKLWQGL